MPRPIARAGSSEHVIMSNQLITAADAREIDRRAVAGGRAFGDLMEAAGRALADAAAGRLAPGGGCLVLCGPGNNGGDGYVAARLLAERGFAVRVAGMPLGADAVHAQNAREGWTGPVADLGVAIEPGDLVLDALFGTGLARDLTGDVAALVERVNASGADVVAADIPSGLDADTGRVLGVAIRATSTVTFVRRKPGHLLYPGRSFCGDVSVASIGIPDAIVADLSPTLFANGPALWRDRMPRHAAESHKYDRGHALVLSGGPANTGAARLAARGALRVGAGLVTLLTSARALAVNAAHLTAIMLRVCDDPDELSDLLTDDRYNALALGPALGVGESTRRWVETALEADRATVLDADALTSFAGDADAFAALTAAPRESAIVLTPHAGEFKRLFAGPGETSEAARAVLAHPSKVEAARAAAAFTGAVIVLKGPDTVIAAPDGWAAINENGTPHLGIAGSGDVLGGITAGLLAQGMPGFEAACAAVWLHAASGAAFGPGLIAEDLPEGLPRVLRELLD